MPPKDPEPAIRLPKLSWIGLGNMGRPMVSNTVRKSYQAFESPLNLYNRTISRAEELSRLLPEGRTNVVRSVHEAVQHADIIFIILFDGGSVKQTILHALETKGGIKEKLFVDCTTIDARTTSEVAELIANAGGEFVAMPVFGVVPVAEAGQLICAPAGPKASLWPSSGAGLKVLGNSLMGCMAEALSEAHAVADKCGMGAMNLHKFVESFPPGQFTMMSGRMVSGDYYKRKTPVTDLALGIKDAQYALDLASKNNTRMKSVETTLAQFHKLEQYADDYGLQGDIMQIYGIARMDAGLPFENGDSSLL